MSATISDRQFRRIERLINATIHELVFACNHAEANGIEEASDAIMTAQGNLDTIAAIISKHTDRKPNFLAQGTK